MKYRNNEKLNQSSDDTAKKIQRYEDKALQDWKKQMDVEHHAFGNLDELIKDPDAFSENIISIIKQFKVCDELLKKNSEDLLDCISGAKHHYILEVNDQLAKEQADKEKQELEILKSYLPQELGEAELSAIVQQIIKEQFSKYKIIKYVLKLKYLN